MAAAKGSKRPRVRQAFDNGPAGVEPGVRTFTKWTPALINSAEINADGGNLRAAANLCDWVLADDRVQGCLHIRLNALFGLEPNFEQSGDGRRRGRAVKALEGEEDYWASYPTTELSLMHSWGLVLGLAPMRHEPEIVRDRGGKAQHGGRILPMPKFWHPQHVRWDGYSQQWLVRVQGASSGTVAEEVLEPGDGEWLLHQPFGTHRPQMLGLWRGLSRWVLLKWLAVGDFGNASAKGSVLTASHERQASQPTELGRSTREQRLQLAKDIYNRGKDGVVVLPPGFSLDLLQLAANSESVYRAQIDLANEAIAIAIRGGNLTTNTKGGSLAAAEAQERLGDQANLVWDGDSVTSTIHDQSLEYWALWNYGDSGLAPWPVYPTRPRRDNEARAATVTKATDAAEGLLSLGLKIKQQAFIEEWELGGWVEADPEQEMLARPSPNPAGAPPGTGPAPGEPDVPPPPSPAIPNQAAPAKP